MMRVKVDERIFPLKVVRMACYNMLDRVEGQIVKDQKGQLVVELKSKDNGDEIQDLEALFNQELIAASVSLDGLERNSSLRDYFAKTAFLPTTYNKKAIEEFIREGKLHASDDADGDRIETAGKDKEGEDAVNARIDGEKGIVFVELPKKKYLISDALFGLREVYADAYGKVAGMSRDKIKIELEIKAASIISLEKLKDSFLTSVNSHKITA